ncbi:hypothetical protein KIN20_028325 [Parelaphostrongylus tenuis]|uniref:Uncharacterized protein n=1 Tax=Parelaphostrongylus tenuis TaxID=148309 RepID=A0AAD5WEQ7_PARTN|nr:hypothetical protein KIN20_028325 [Parelaphostrongylus tenuis]
MDTSTIVVLIKKGDFLDVDDHHQYLVAACCVRHFTRVILKRTNTSLNERHSCEQLLNQEKTYLPRTDGYLFPPHRDRCEGNPL